MKRTLALPGIPALCFTALCLFSGLFSTDCLANGGSICVDGLAEYRVKWDGQYIDGITKVTGLRRVTEVITERGGDDPNTIHRSPGFSTYEPIVLERCRTHDKKFERWSNKVWNYGSGFGSEVSLKDFRKDIIIELCNDDGQTVMAFRVYRCWPSEYIAMSDLDPSGETVAMESIVLQHEGWERDYDVIPPTIKQLDKLLKKVGAK